MYKNLEKVYVEKFEDIDRYSSMDNKLYILKYPHMKHYHKWIYNKYRERLEPLTWLDMLFEFKHAPGKLDKVDNSHDYIKVDNINRTQADGLDPELYDRWQQHFMIDTSKLDNTLDDLVNYKHVPGKIDKKDNNFDYIVVENVNRTQADGLKEGLVDNEQQHFILDTSKLDERLNEIEPQETHVPSKLDKSDTSHTYIKVNNTNRTQSDGLPEGMTDTMQQHHMIDTSELDSTIDNLGLNKHVPGKIDMLEGSKDYVKVTNANRTNADGLPSGLTDINQQHFLVDTSKLDETLDKIPDVQYQHVPAKLEKADEEFDYITVENTNRSQDDGLPAGLTDTLAQKHVVNTSKLDFIIDNLQVNNGTEVVIYEEPEPGTVVADGTKLPLGDVTQFNDIKVYFKSNSMSVNQSVNFLTPTPNLATSFILTNIGDNPTTQKIINGEIGQTLGRLNDDMTNATLELYSTAVWRFRTDLGDGANGSWNNITQAGGNNFQPKGEINFGKMWVPYPSGLPGDGWVEVIKITGVVYGGLSIEKGLEVLIKRLNSKLYCVYYDYNRYIKFAIGSHSTRQLDLLEHLEAFKTELEEEPVPISNPDTLKYKNYYEYLVEYRETLRKEAE